MLEESINKETEAVANRLGEALVFAFRRAIAEKKPYPGIATGELINTMTHKVKVDGSGRVALQILAEPYFRFLDKGRGPNKNAPPPRGSGGPRQPGPLTLAIQGWVRVKGIDPKAVYPIVRKIATKGYKGLNFVNVTIDKVTAEFKPEFEAELERILGVVLVNDVFNATTTKGRILPKTLR